MNGPSLFKESNDCAKTECSEPTLEGDCQGRLCVFERAILDNAAQLVCAHDAATLHHRQQEEPMDHVRAGDCVDKYVRS